MTDDNASGVVFVLFLLLLGAASMSALAMDSYAEAKCYESQTKTSINLRCNHGMTRDD